MKLWIRLALLVLTLLVLLAATVFVAVRWRSIPEQIPAHYDAAGHITDWTGKVSLISLLVLDWAMAVLVAVTARMSPEARRKYGIRVSAVRFGKRTVLAATGLMLDVLALVLALIFSYIIVCSALCRELGAWFLPATLAAVFLPILIPTVESLRK